MANAINWGIVERPPTKKELRLYRKWKKYLSDSRLSKSEIETRARRYAGDHMEVPNG